MNLKEYFKQRFILILSEQEETMAKPNQGKELPDEVRKPRNCISTHYHGGRTRDQSRTSSANARARASK